MAVDNVTDALKEAIRIKDAIREKIISKEVDVPEDTPFADYPAKVDAIKGILQTKNITPTAAGGTVSPDTGYDGFSKVTLPVEPNLIPNNISEGVSIYGVTGTASTATFDLAQFFARKLTELSLGVPEIGDYAFYMNTALQYFTDTSLKTLGEYAFYQCTGLRSFIASALLNKLKQYAFYGCTALATMDLSNIEEIGDYALYNCYALAPATLAASKIGNHGCYYLGNNTQGFNYTPENAATISDYGLQYARIKKISGTIKNVGNYGLANLPSIFTEFAGKFTGAIGNYGFANNQYVKTIDLSTSNITKLGQYALYYLGWSRANVSSDPYMRLDMRNSKFNTVDQYSLGYIRYADIYLPAAVVNINNYAFYGCQNINIYMTGAAPTLASTNAFSNMSNYRIFAPWTYLASYTEGTNWTNYSANIVGYAAAGSFTAGDTLPRYNAEGYEMTWYTDEAKTNQVTVCPAGSPMLYCTHGGVKVKQVVTIAISGPLTLAITDSNNVPVDYSYGFFLCSAGENYNIAASSLAGYTYSINVNGTKVTAFPYTLAVSNTDIAIKGTAYDPTAVNPDYVNATWREIKTAAEAGIAGELYADYVGNEDRTINLTNGQTVAIRLSNASQELYELADGSRMGCLGFEFVDAVNGTYKMNDSNTNNGGWHESKMRNTHMAEFFDMLPDELKELIATVKTISVKSGYDGTLVESEDKLFLLAEREIFGSRQYSRPEEWNSLNRWEYYEQNDTPAARIKNVNGSPYTCFERSAYSGNSSGFCCVGNSGNANGSSAGSSRGAAPAFIF